MVIWLRGGGTSAGFLIALKERPDFEEGFRLFHESIVRSVWDVREQTTVPDVCSCTSDAQVDGKCSCVICQPVASQATTDDSPASEAGICVGADTGVSHPDSNESSTGDLDDEGVRQSLETSSSRAPTMDESTSIHRKHVHVFSERTPQLELPVDAGEEDLKQFLQVLKVEANRVAVISQLHVHSFTCFKNKACTCRFSFPKMVHELTHLMEETQHF
jgi:hypothetical protein